LNGGTPQASGFTVSVQNLVVREEADIQRVAEQLYKLEQREKRARGIA